MSIKIHMLTLGVVRTHCYILGDTQTNEAVVIDPADSAETILGILREEGWQLKEILATHTHFDHILAARELKSATGAMFRVHELDLQQLHLMPEITERLIGQAA